MRLKLFCFTFIGNTTKIMKLKFLFLTLTSALILLIYSCGNKIPMKKSSVVPAAEAKIKVKEMDNGNYSISVKIENLASPDKLSPERKYYIVWVKSKKGTFNLGMLDLDDELNGSLETQTTYEPRKILISAEDDKEVVKISKQVVLESKKI